MSRWYTLREILIIDDDRELRTVVGQVFEEQGFAVHLAQNGREGLEQLAGGVNPNVILLDLSMPVMGGREFLAELRKASPLIPVVVMTADANVSGLAGAQAVLQKPVSVERLVKVVAAAVREAGHEP